VQAHNVQQRAVAVVVIFVHAREWRDSNKVKDRWLREASFHDCSAFDLRSVGARVKIFLCYQDTIKTPLKN
jgi:hypothetical protein